MWQRIGEDGHINYTEFVASLLQVQGAEVGRLV